MLNLFFNLSKTYPNEAHFLVSDFSRMGIISVFIDSLHMRVKLIGVEIKDILKNDPFFPNDFPQIFKIDILQTRENTVLVKVEGQLIRSGLFERQGFVESPRFTLNLTLVRNPNMIVNKRYPLGVWKFEYRLG